MVGSSTMKADLEDLRIPGMSIHGSAALLWPHRNQFLTIPLNPSPGLGALWSLEKEGDCRVWMATALVCWMWKCGKIVGHWGHSRYNLSLMPWSYPGLMVPADPQWNVHQMLPEVGRVTFQQMWHIFSESSEEHCREWRSMRVHREEPVTRAGWGDLICDLGLKRLMDSWRKAVLLKCSVIKCSSLLYCRPIIL